MTTLTGYVASPALYREVGIEAQPGDQVEIYLDQVKVPGFPEFIVGTIQNPVTVVCGGTSYPIEYDETDLAGSGVEFIEGDDILSIVVVSEARVLFAAEQAERIAGDNLRVLKAGDTMTGPLVLTGNTTTLTLSGTNGGIFTSGTNGTIYTTGTAAAIATSGNLATIFTQGSAATIYTSGAYAGIYTLGSNAALSTAGVAATISTAGASAHIFTTGVEASIYTQGNNATIQTSGLSGLIKTTGQYAVISTEGANAVIQTSGANAHIQTVLGDIVSGGKLRVTNPQTPATSGASGVVGQIAWDANYVYVCIALNTWKRSPLTTW